MRVTWSRILVAMAGFGISPRETMASESIFNANCAQLTSPLLEDTTGNPGYPYDTDSIEITSQDVDTVTFNVKQLWVDGGTPMIALGYRSGSSEVCDIEVEESALLEFGFEKEYTAQCTNGYAEVNVYYYVGDANAFSVEECEACNVPDDNYVAYYLSIPCVPVCYPKTPDCLLEPQVILADLGYESACIYDSNPIIVTESDNGDGSFSFKIDNTWTPVGSNDVITSLSVSYTDVGGSNQCDDINVGDDFSQTSIFNAKCDEDGLSTVLIQIYGNSLDHEPTAVSDICTQKDEGSCSYEFVIPCSISEECSPTTSPPQDCVDATTESISIQDTAGNVDAYPDFEPPLTINVQAIDEVTFTVTQDFEPNGLAMLSVGYRNPTTAQEMCDLQTPFDAGEMVEITAECAMGFAEIALYFYVGDKDAFSPEDCEACTIPNEDDYVAYYMAIPCTPVCKPAIPTCLDDPIVSLADIGAAEGDIDEMCVFDEMPVVVETSSMTDDSVAFSIQNSWPSENGDQVTSVSISYDNGQGLVCEEYIADELDGTQMVTAACVDGVTSVIVSAFSAGIQHQAQPFSPSACESKEENEGLGMCAYEIVVPCLQSICSATPNPTGAPTGVPTANPSGMPSSSPSASPSLTPSTSPTDMPTAKPSTPPSTSPSASPSGSPSSKPSASPSASPSDSPSSNPSDSPSSAPSSKPTSKPSSSPSDAPSSSPSESPSGSYFPSTAPSESPTKSAAPSSSPSGSPSSKPSFSPSSSPSASPSEKPSAKPSSSPSASPSDSPSDSPSAKPSASPSASPSDSPSSNPSDSPSSAPSSKPTSKPSSSPSDAPSSSPSESPSGSYFPSTAPSESPTKSAAPSSSPSGSPSSKPSFSPSSSPSASPSEKPSAKPSSSPSASPSDSPSDSPSAKPSASPSASPSDSPSSNPSDSPSSAPSSKPTSKPSSSPSDAPSSSPSESPSGSYFPSTAPSESPTKSAAPSSSPSGSPSSKPSFSPSSSPSASPSEKPSAKPSSSPSASPSDSPSDSPSAQPSASPSASPSDSPSSNPSDSPSSAPSSKPTSKPSSSPSDAPSSSPSESPSGSYFPSIAPSESPTKSAAPSSSPSDTPSNSPSAWPSVGPTSGPTKSPTKSPSESPSTSPSASPTSAPTKSHSSTPTTKPSLSPSSVPSASPSASPSSSPTVSPSASPSSTPSASPTDAPSSSLAPTDCFMPAPPKIVESVCMTTSGTPMDLIEMPGNAIAITRQNGGNELSFTVSQQWRDSPTGLAVRSGVSECSLYSDQLLGASLDFEGECFEGEASVTIVVYMDDDFDPDECEACNVEDLESMGGNHEFCAYRVEIPCEKISGECGEPSASPSGSYFPSIAPSEGPTQSASPSGSPTGSPSRTPTTKPSLSPTSVPSASPSASPSSSPTVSPSASPTGLPTVLPSASPSSTPSASPTDAPSSSLAPTDCFMPAPPKIVESVCMTTSGTPMDLIEMPGNAIAITRQNGGNELSFTVSQQWRDSPTGLAVRSGVSECSLYSDQLLGASLDFEGECFEGEASVTIVVYMDDDFDPDECEACNVEDLESMGGNHEFCAYRVEIPCEKISGECGEPSASPSGSYFPSIAPSEGPTQSASPSGSPTGSPSLSPTGGPSPSPSESPSVTSSASPTSASTESPSGTPTTTPSSSPTADPTSSVAPTDCFTPSPPQVVETVCMDTNGNFMDEMKPFPTDAITITNQGFGVATLEYTVSQTWTDANVGLAIQSGAGNCLVKGDVISGDSENVSGLCIEEVASVTVVVYFDESFEPEECDACNVENLQSMGGGEEFCAYRIELPCTPVAIDCGEPSASPSVAASGSPTVSIHPTAVPSGVPSSDPSTSPSESPTGSPTISPTVSPSVSPTGYPTRTPTGTPSESPTTSQPTITADTDTPSNKPSYIDPIYECPESEAILISNEGETLYSTSPITITSQNTTHVAFTVENTFSATASSIFTEYHSGSFGETECLEEENVEEMNSIETEFIAQCMVHAKISIVNIWITDCNDALPFLEESDNAEIPECCHPGDQCRTVQYTFKLPCEDLCPEDEPLMANTYAPTSIQESSLDLDGNSTDFDFGLIENVTDYDDDGLGGNLTEHGYDSNSTEYAEEPENGNRRNLNSMMNSNPSVRVDNAQLEDLEDEDHFCVVEDYPCGPENDKVHVCHYSARDGYKTFCVPESDSDALRFYPKDYCGPCVGGYSIF